MLRIFFIRYHFQFPGDFKNNVTICDLSSNEDGAGKIQCKAPKYEDAPISCMALHPKTKTLFVVYSNHHFVECCTKTGKYTKLTMTLHENEELIPKVPSIYYVITFRGEGVHKKPNFAYFTQGRRGSENEKVCTFSTVFMPT